MYSDCHLFYTFYSCLMVQSYADYIYAKRVCKDLKQKKLREYYDLYVQSDILSLADVFNNI